MSESEHEVSGYIIKDGVAYETAKHRKLRIKRELSARMRTANIPTDMLDYNPDVDYLGEKSLNEVLKLKKVLEWSSSTSERHVKLRELARKSMYYMYGVNGTQKTHLAWWLGKELCRNGETVYFTTMQAILQDLTNLELNKDPDSEVYRRIQKCKNVQFLFLDESFDKSKVTIFKSNFQIPYLDDLIRSRTQSNKANFFISNNKYNEIEDIVGKSIQDFVYRNVTIAKTNMVFEDIYINNLDRYKGQSLISLF